MKSRLTIIQRPKQIVLYLQHLLIVIALGTLTLRAETDHAKHGCRRQLSFLFEAIQAHNERYQRYPNWLSDLVPEFLADPKTLICPKAKSLGIRGPESGIILSTVYSDPKTSYGYERCTGILEPDIWKGRPITYADYKNAQMKRVGSVVPIVRCPNHGVHLNLSHAGVIYESGLYWEATQAVETPRSELEPAHLFASPENQEKDQPDHPTAPNQNQPTLPRAEEDQRQPTKKTS